MSHSIPVIETERLVLRGPEAEDYPNFEATFSSYRARFMGGPLNAYESWMLYAAEIGHWQIHGFGMWMIHDKQTDETYGRRLDACGLARTGNRLDHLARRGRAWLCAGSHQRGPQLFLRDHGLGDRRQLP